MPSEQTKNAATMALLVIVVMATGYLFYWLIDVDSFADITWQANEVRLMDRISSVVSFYDARIRDDDYIGSLDTKTDASSRAELGTVMEGTESQFENQTTSWDPLRLNHKLGNAAQGLSPIEDPSYAPLDLLSEPPAVEELRTLLYTGKQRELSDREVDRALAILAVVEPAMQPEPSMMDRLRDITGVTGNVGSTKSNDSSDTAMNGRFDSSSSSGVISASDDNTVSDESDYASEIRASGYLGSSRFNRFARFGHTDEMTGRIVSQASVGKRANLSLSGLDFQDVLDTAQEPSAAPVAPKSGGSYVLGLTGDTGTFAGVLDSADVRSNPHAVAQLHSSRVRAGAAKNITFEDYGETL